MLSRAACQKKGACVDTELLRTFLEVRNTRHFGRAAENLFITQAAVSARIRQLEELLGATLFIRNRNNIQLSSEGERLVPHAETVLLALERARREVRLQEAASRQLYLGVRTGLWGRLMQQRLHALQAGDPDLALRVESRESAELERKLVDRTLDLAIGFEPSGIPELESRAVGRLTLLLYSSDGEASLQSALGEGYVLVDWGDGFARFHERRFGEQRLPRMHTNLVGLARRQVQQQGGACYLPASDREELGLAGLLPVQDAPSFSRQLYLVHHSGTPRRGLIGAVAEAFQGVEL